MAMDPNPTSFPILSYVMARLPSLGAILAPTTPEFDIEQPPPPPSKSDPTSSLGQTQEIVTQMPHLTHPKVLASMTHAISDVTQTRSVLRTLGPRPDHETVDKARAKLAEIESSLSKSLEGLVLSTRPAGVDRLQWRAHLAEKEKRFRVVAQKEKSLYRSVLRSDEMHEAYGKLLKEAEERLVRIYDSAEKAAEGAEEDNVQEREEINEEVVGILQEASGNPLERVDLSGRRLKSVPDAFGKIQGLLVLNLSNNCLEAIHDLVAGMQNLTELNISSNLLESLPDSIGLLHNLKILDASGNKLSALPDAICHCRSLVELDASFNRLAYLPTNIGLELVNLQRLSIHLNKIRSLPTSVGEMRSLLYLDAHFNELRGLPLSIGRLTNLEILNLSSNFSDLTELPDTIGDLTNLKELDLSNNQVHALPDTFGRLEKLTKLNLQQNPLVIPPMDVVKEGVEAVKIFMAKRWFDILVEEERKYMIEENEPAETGWLTRSTSLLKTYVSGYLGGGNSPRDPYLDQQL